jgi:uncharacterized protein (TIGR03083 family)
VEDEDAENAPLAGHPGQHERVADDMWQAIHAERRALADDLTGLDASRWGTPSLDAGWTVHDVLAHMTATARMTPPAIMLKMARAGFNFPRFADREIAAVGAGGPEATLARFRTAETSTSAPPGPKLSWMGETLVHAEDIRRPLGLAHDYPTDWVTQVIAFYSGSNVLIGGKRRVQGLTLRATDADFSHGSGPVVEGPAMSLLMATAGRRVALDDLIGDGLATLRSR